MVERAGRYTSRKVFGEQFASAVELQSETKMITVHKSKKHKKHFGHYGLPE
jgi:hypothetical protein